MSWPEHLVDGGYFDNSGSASAESALPAFLSAARDAGLAERIQPIALMITSDKRRQPLAMHRPTAHRCRCPTAR